MKIYVRIASQLYRLSWLLLAGWLLAGCNGQPTPAPLATAAAPADGLATVPPTAAATPTPLVGYPAPAPSPVDDGYPAPATAVPVPGYPADEATAVAPARYSYNIVNSYPHNPDSFTQGLEWDNGRLLEGTGQRGASALLSVDLATGDIQERVPLDERYWGEGITRLGDRIYQLTWQAQTAFVYDADTFALLETFSYPTEGWGLTNDGERLIMSDGSATLFFRDPLTFAETGRVTVSDGEGPLRRLNELEYINGLVYANIFGTDTVVQIDPDNGAVVGYVDLTGLREAAELPESVLSDAYLNSNAVLNGIAYDGENGRLFVTGKLWPKLFEIELTPLD